MVLVGSSSSENDSSIAQVTQLVDEKGVFNAAGLDNFVRTNPKLARCGVDYAVVSIMGPQSSGKSTLMNHLFNTKFPEMNAEQGRNQTTKGIWLSECVGIKPFTMILDLEGNDGQERGQDTVFEKQAALFALAVSDILMINMRSNEIGRENAANKPLLRTIFAVMLQSLGPGRRTTLIFIIRDLEKTPLDVLKRSLVHEIHTIWNEVPKPKKYRTTQFNDAFKVEVVGLPHYVHQEDKFIEEVARLRERFTGSLCRGGLAGDVSRDSVVPAMEFSFSSQQLWNLITKNQNLNLPDHKVMVSNVRCEAIANDKLDQLRKNEDWKKLSKTVEDFQVKDFGKMLSSILAPILSEYDEEVQYFDKTVRKMKRKEVLERKALDEVYPAYEAMLGHIRHSEFENFKAKMEQSGTNKKEELYQSVFTNTEAAVSAFDKASRECLVVIARKEPLTQGGSLVKDSSVVKWDAENVRDKLRCDIQLHAITLFSSAFMEPDTKPEEAEKEFENGWLEWLLARLGHGLDNWLINSWGRLRY